MGQGIEAVEYILMQDKKNAILLESNWPYSTGKGSGHIKIQHIYAIIKIKWKGTKNRVV